LSSAQLRSDLSDRVQIADGLVNQAQDCSAGIRRSNASPTAFEQENTQFFLDCRHPPTDRRCVNSEILRCAPDITEVCKALQSEKVTDLHTSTAGST